MLDTRKDMLYTARHREPVLAQLGEADAGTRGKQSGRTSRAASPLAEQSMTEGSDGDEEPVRTNRVISFASSAGVNEDGLNDRPDEMIKGKTGNEGQK
jgi:hypothetical protein